MAWMELAEAVKSGGEPMSVVRALVSLADDSQKLLQQIDRKLDALLRGPYHTGCCYLEEAKDPRRSKARRLESLKMARTEFMLAWGQLQNNHLYATLIALNLGAIWIALGSRPDAAKWLKQAEYHVRRLWADVTNDLLPKSHGGKMLYYGGVLVTMPIAGVLGPRQWDKFAAERAQRQAVEISRLEHTILVLLYEAERNYENMNRTFWYSWPVLQKPLSYMDEYSVSQETVSEEEFNLRAAKLGL